MFKLHYNLYTRQAFVVLSLFIKMLFQVYYFSEFIHVVDSGHVSKKNRCPIRVDPGPQRVNKLRASLANPPAMKR